VPQPYNPAAELVRTIKSILWSAGFISFLMVLILSFIVVMAMTPEIQQWISTPVPSASDPATLVLPQEYIFIIIPWPLLLFSIEGPIFQAWHLLIFGILFCSFAYAKFDLIRSWLSTKEGAIKSLSVPEKATSSLEGVAKLFMASISFSVLYFIFLRVIEVEMNSPDFESLSRPELIYGLFAASVFEELISRVLLIGVPLLFIGLAMKWKNPLNKILGGGLGLTPMTFILIAFSATMFAFAHVGSWDLWKVPQVLVTGFALGWAFVRYGLHASILIHFTINLSYSALEIWPDHYILELALGLAILIWMVAGAYFLVHYAIELTMKLAPGLRPKPAPAAYMPPPPHWQYAYQQSPQAQYQPPPPPPQWQGQATVPPPPPPQWQGQATVPPPAWAYRQPQPAQNPPPQPAAPIKSMDAGGFVCPKCGHTSASYDSGKLICLKCGTAHYKEGVPEKVVEKEQIEF
jgi:hypothetical protein